MKKLILMLLAIMVMASFAQGEATEPAKATEKDKCPVCGMFVAKYPDFLCQVVFKDGTRAFFDGAKDMFKYALNLSKYNPGKTKGDIQAVFVTDYYDLVPIDGFKAYYVVGSTVYGPMGKELIPFADEEAAREFLVDHSGSAVLRFEEVTAETLKPLD